MLLWGIIAVLLVAAGSYGAKRLLSFIARRCRDSEHRLFDESLVPAPPWPLQERVRHNRALIRSMQEEANSDEEAHE